MSSRQRTGDFRSHVGRSLFFILCIGFCDTAGSLKCGTSALPLADGIGRVGAKSFLMAFCTPMLPPRTHRAINKPSDAFPSSVVRVRRAGISEMLRGTGTKTYATTMRQQQSYDDIDRRLQSYKYPESPYDFETAAMPKIEEQTVTPRGMFETLIKVRYSLICTARTQCMRLTRCLPTQEAEQYASSPLLSHQMTKHVLLRDDLTEALASVLASKLCSEDLPEHLLFSKLTKVGTILSSPLKKTDASRPSPGQKIFLRF